SSLRLEVDLRSELNNARRIRRGEATELGRRVIRNAFDANASKPVLTEGDRAGGDSIHILEVGPVEEIEGVEDEFDPERTVRAEADWPSHSHISAEEHRPEAGVAPYRDRAVVVVGVEVDVKSRHDVEGETAARSDDRR